MKKLLIGMALIMLVTAFAACGPAKSAQKSDANQTPKATVSTQSQDNKQTDAKEKVVGLDMGRFLAADQNGKTVTQDIFKDKDITMVNFWATWCGACVDEMGALQELYEKMGEKVNLITVCLDMNEQKELVSKIMEKDGYEFITISPDDAINNGILKGIQAFPTTVFVDKEGNIVGEPIVGVEGGSEDDIVKSYQQAIEERLKQIKK